MWVFGFECINRRGILSSWLHEIVRHKAVKTLESAVASNSIFDILSDDKKLYDIYVIILRGTLSHKLRMTAIQHRPD